MRNEMREKDCLYVKKISYQKRKRQELKRKFVFSVMTALFVIVFTGSVFSKQSINVIFLEFQVQIFKYLVFSIQEFPHKVYYMAHKKSIYFICFSKIIIKGGKQCHSMR